MSLISDIIGKIFKPSGANATPPPSATSSAAPTTATQAPVNVDKILSDLSKQNSQTLNWKTSIVDLMKVLSMDSSLASRQQLAKELNYLGDVNDSAAMNTWLHKQVMQKLAANGGHVPPELLH